MGRWWRSWTGRAVLLALVVGALVALPMVAQAVETDPMGRVTVEGTGAALEGAYVNAVHRQLGLGRLCNAQDVNGDYKFAALARRHLLGLLRRHLVERSATTSGRADGRKYSLTPRRDRSS